MEVKGVNGTVRFDGHTVTIVRGRFMPGKQGKGQKAIPVHSISAVQLKPPGLTGLGGSIEFTIPGGVERGSRRGRDKGAKHDENTVTFYRQHANAFEQLRDAVQAAIAGLHAPSASPSPPAPAGSVADELTKLVGLRDAGVLSDAEFDAQKAKLLG
jgi:hypothetical protein